MLKQLRGVLRSYRRLIVCLGCACGSALLGVGVTLVAVYLVFHIRPGSDGVPTLSEALARKPIPLFAWFAILAVIVLIHASVLGLQLRTQFVTYRSRLIPNWNLPHLGVAFALIVPFITLSPAALAIHHMTDSWSLMSWVSAFGLLWSAALAGFSMGYFTHRMMFLNLPLMMILLVGVRSRVVQVFSIVVQQGSLIPAVTLVLVNAAWSIGLVRRMVHFHEEMPEFDWLASISPSEQQPPARTSGAQERGLRGRIAARLSGKLDAARVPLHEDFLSYVRHFQMGASMFQVTLFSAVFMIPYFWVVKFFFFRKWNSGLGNAMLMLTFIPLFLLFWIPMLSQRKSFQWIFMLPMRRRDVVIRYGSAMFLSFLKAWLSFTLVVFVVELLPLPWVYHGLPSLRPYLLSLAVQFAGFGILTLMLITPRDKMKRCGAAILLVLALIFGSAAYLSRIIPGAGFAPSLTIVATIVGIVLIGISYRVWLRTDLD